MTIIGQTGNGWIVEVRDTELARITGQTRGWNNKPKIGEVVNVNEMWNYMDEILKTEEKIKHVSSLLKMYADTIGSIPNPIEIKKEEEQKSE